MKYLNLDLEASQYQKNDTKESFRVRVAGSPVGEMRPNEAEEVVVPQDLRLRLSFLEDRDLTTPELIELGIMLGQLLLPARARVFLDRSRERLKDDQGLRIRLKLDTYALANLPWEFSYIPDADTPSSQRSLEGFLVLDRRLSLVRYEMLSQGLANLEPGKQETLRMAVILANPSDPSFPPLDLTSEQQIIEQALKGISQINAQFYSNATVETLHEAITTGANVFHFAGHGSFQADMGSPYGSTEMGYIVLVGDNGKERLFSSTNLALILRGRDVRLVVLGACEGGRRDGVNAWTGVVPALTRAGIPAVIGMQYKIADTNAITFSRNFYRALAAHQSIDEALTAGRLAILTGSSEEVEFDWGVPVLYLRADEEEGILFPAATDSQPTTVKPDVISTGGTTKTPSPSDNVDPRALRTKMIESFNREDLELLCADVEADLRQNGIAELVNLEMVGGSGIPAIVLNLIKHMERRRLLPYLVKAVRSARPGLI
jgi:CHAT domain